MGIRRVVTGHNSTGKSIVASDTEVAPIELALAPGMQFYRLWGADSPPAYPDSGSPLPHHTYFPPTGGSRFIQFTIPPSSAAAPADVADIGAAVADAEAKLPGLLGHMEPDNPGFHRTDTVDYLYVVSGEVILGLDDGIEVHLKAGDTAIQSGTRHAWRNPGSEPCTIVGVLVGAKRQP
jgi:mannose-6-phosphate isomerase-like protein (cupin superfamily)